MERKGGREERSKRAEKEMGGTLWACPPVATLGVTWLSEQHPGAGANSTTVHRLHTLFIRTQSCSDWVSHAAAISCVDHLNKTILILGR